MIPSAGAYGYRKCLKSRSEPVEMGPRISRLNGSHVALAQHICEVSSQSVYYIAFTLGHKVYVSGIVYI